MFTTPQGMALLAASKESSSRKVNLPGITPGFKANALTSTMPPKIENAFAAYAYVPYSALTKRARQKNLKGSEAMIISEGGIVARGIDRSDERNITILEWSEASRMAVEATRKFHGDSYGNALEAHHRLVLDLAYKQGDEIDAWPIAMAYDILQRELAAANRTHDLSTLDAQAVMLVTSQRILARSATQPSSSQTSSHASAKRSAPATSDSPTKRQRMSSSAVCSSLCFRCGNTGHLPRECSASQTKSGKAVFALSSDQKHHQ